MRRAASYDFDSMKPALTLICALLLSSAVHAQAPSTTLTPQNPIAPPGPVPISEEPHHRLVLQNDFTKVYNVMVSPLDATLLHQHDLPYLETDEIRVDLFKVSSGRDYVDPAPKVHALLVALTDANLDANLGGEHIQFLHGGDVLWLPAGQHRRIVDLLGTRSSFLLISFKDSAPAPATQ